MASRYMILGQFKARTVMPSADVDALESVEPGWLQTSLDDWSDEIDARLAKRYDVPFGDAAVEADTPRQRVPRVVMRWLTALVTRDAYAKRGFNPASAQDQAAILGYAERAEKEIAEAANSETGLFELPQRSSEATTAITRGAPLSYAEASPYRGFDLQARDGNEDDLLGI